MLTSHNKPGRYTLLSNDYICRNNLRQVNKTFLTYKVHKCKFDLRIFLQISCIFHNIWAICWWGFKLVTIATYADSLCDSYSFSWTKILLGVFWTFNIKWFTSLLRENLQLVENKVFILKVMMYWVFFVFPNKRI